MAAIRLFTFGMIVLLTKMNLAAQDTITINFNAEYHIVDEKGHGFMKLIDNQSNEVIYEGNRYKVTFPNQFFVGDTAIAFNYFTGWENPSIENSTAFLFGNYKSHSPIVYVDYNHNLDFSDDGQPLKFNIESTLTIYLINSKMPSAFFPIKFFYPKLEPKQKKQIESIFTAMGPDAEGNSIVGIDYWLADKRMNYKIANSWLNGNYFKIGLYDYDCNGLFNDKGEDRVLIGDYEENKIFDSLEKGAFEYTEEVQIPIGNEIYEVVEIEATGKYLKLIQSNRIYNKPLGIGDYVGDLQIMLVSGDTVQISQLQKENKYFLLDFWGSWCRGCTQQLPDLKKVASENSDKIEIFGLNYGDNISSIENYISKHEINWENGIANNELMRLLRIDGFPNYLLLNPKGEILIMNGTINEIERRL